jgi:hypothetical protein
VAQSLLFEIVRDDPEIATAFIKFQPQVSDFLFKGIIGLILFFDLREEITPYFFEFGDELLLCLLD